VEELMNLDKLVKQDPVDLEAEAAGSSNKAAPGGVGGSGQIIYRFLQVI
jgi:hypothetical protein